MPSLEEYHTAYLDLPSVSGEVGVERDFLLVFV